ncbi:NAD(P) transhydrogenase [Gregarina niphandrodes]|uniref:proton-translocating NAD(P)(+) transhydrogenase n=1 Tax=Gregarina niphandrodes TaxID=110365 RepID=A0A023AZG6_GRENI|nr:NAD(P) transhydrogenase [Gregarina niphandrodes]EZG44089.1 NAD(P) transhydrogenase [Gregarina niphandrodes]|eukprot:XP_011132816.1 NAD(P) transhydrogenase [Gregarina niphandrodes]
MTSAPPEFAAAREPCEPEGWFLVAGAAAAALYLAGTFVFAKDISELTFLAAALCCVAAVATFADLRTARAGVALALGGVLLGCTAALGVALLPLARHRARSWALLRAACEGPTLVAGSAAVGATALGTAAGALLGGAAGAAELPQTLALCLVLAGVAGAATACAYFAKYAPDAGRSLGVDLNYNGVKAFCVLAGAVLGAMTAAGALVAALKLHGLARGPALHVPGRNSFALVAFGALVVLGALFVLPPDTTGLIYAHLLCGAILVAAGLGSLLVVGCAVQDMAVCLALLSGLAGWTLVAEGFALDNLLLTIVGCLVGVIGGLQVRVLGRAANRTLSAVLLAHPKPLTVVAETTASIAAATGLEAGLLDPRLSRTQTTSVEAVAETLAEARQVVVVPGFGLSIAGAQWALSAVVLALLKREVEVHVALHPNAGRLPGHMHVVLAEAGVPTSIVRAIEVEGPHDINQDVNQIFAQADVALVVGAHDLTNSAAVEDPNSALAGKPVLHVWKAKNCVFLRHHTQMDNNNPVYAKENVSVLLGDPKHSLEALNIHVQSHSLI